MSDVVYRHRLNPQISNTLFAVDGGPEDLQAGLNTTTSVCWEAYRTLVPCVTSLSLKHTSNTFCSTLIIVVTILLNQ